MTIYGINSSSEQNIQQDDDRRSACKLQKQVLTSTGYRRMGAENQGPEAHLKKAVAMSSASC